MDRACFFASGIASAKVDTSTANTHPFQKALNPIFLVVPGGLIHQHLRFKRFMFEITFSAIVFLLSKWQWRSGTLLSNTARSTIAPVSSTPANGATINASIFPTCLASFSDMSSGKGGSSTLLNLWSNTGGGMGLLSVDPHYRIVRIFPPALSR